MYEWPVVAVTVARGRRESVFTAIITDKAAWASAVLEYTNTAVSVNFKLIFYLVECGLFFFSRRKKESDRVHKIPHKKSAR